jgi:hypothetical protein
MRREVKEASRGREKGENKISRSLPLSLPPLKKKGEKIRQGAQNWKGTRQGQGGALLARHPGVVLVAHADPGHLILVAVLQLAAAQQLLDLALCSVHQDVLEHLLPLLLRDLPPPAPPFSKLPYQQGPFR